MVKFKRHQQKAAAAAAGRKPVNFRGKGNPPDQKPHVEGVPLGAIIPRLFSNDPHLLSLNQPGSTMAERFRRLAVKLDQLTMLGGNPPQIVIISSAVPGEGKTLTAVNLALAMSEDKSRSVLLVDGDLRRPSIGRYLMNPKPQLGLSEVLGKEVPIDHAVVQIKNSNVRVLPSGAPNETPLEHLRSNRLKEVFEDLRERFDRIVVDTPPTIPFADASAILQQSDGALMVVRARRTARPMIARALETLEGGEVLGVVLNDVKSTPIDRYYYQYDAYDPERYAKRGGK